MTHIRTLVRNYVANRLLNNTDAQDRIFKSKVTPNRGPFPLIGIYTSKDELDSVNAVATPYEQYRIITLEIQCELSAITPDYDTKLDDLCGQVESRIDYRLGKGIDNLKSCEHDTTTLLYKEDGERITAIALMSYNVTYLADESGLINPADLENLDSIYTEWHLDVETANDHIAKTDTYSMI